MSEYVFKLPDVGEGIAEAELVKWHVKEGDQVEEDQPIADVMTDKATVEITSPVDGKVTKLHRRVGDMAQIGAPLIAFETGAAASAEPEKTEEKPESPAPVKETVSAPAPVAPPPPDASEPVKVLASPAVRKRAKDLGIPLEEVVKTTGPESRVRHRDLDTYLAYQDKQPGEPKGTSAKSLQLPPVMPIPDASYEEQRLVGLRRKIAEKMELSSRHIPHFSYIEEIDMTELEAARARLNTKYADERGKLTILPFLIRALCLCLPDYPQINSHFDEAGSIIRRYKSVNVGIATQTPNGLMVPVVKDADKKGLWELASDIIRVSSGARDGSIARSDVSGSTITITSLGPLGGIATTPVINHPEVGILGPNKIADRVMVKDGEFVVRKMMNLSSSFDHRVVDGDDAARIIQDIRKLLEDPVLLVAQ